MRSSKHPSQSGTTDYTDNTDGSAPSAASAKSAVKNSASALRANPDWAKLPLFDRKGWWTMAFGEFAESVNERVEPADAADDIYVGLDDLDSGIRQYY